MTLDVLQPVHSNHAEPMYKGSQLMKIIQIDQDPLRTTVKKNKKTKKKTIRTKDHHTDNDHIGNQYDY